MSLHYLVDGFNLLYALPDMPPGPWERKRQALVEWLRRRRPHGNNRLTIVFDSRQGFGDRQQMADCEVIYTAGQTADDWISEQVRRVPNPRIVVVVTNDRGLQTLIRGTGARIVSCDDFVRWARKDQPRRPPSSGGEDDRSQITDEFKKKWL
ncbi:MAG TPA: NYN domain-containing protein [Elusimicrobiota bacterium]|nr:NYN domain-containing protein [Elusimicrobiota bacterium]